MFFLTIYTLTRAHTHTCTSTSCTHIHTLTHTHTHTPLRRILSLTLPILQSIPSFTGSGVFLTHPVLEFVLSFVGRRVYLTRPLLVCVSSRDGGECLVHASSWNLCVRSVCSFGGWGVSLTRPVMKTSLSLGGKYI